MTGPLIAPTGTVIPVGHFTIQPYFYFNTFTGNYNAHWNSVSIPNFYASSLQLQVFAGITQWMDVQIFPLVICNATQGQTSVQFADLPLGVDFQLITDTQYRWFPGVKLQLVETFPTGKYQKLNPKKLLTDSSGLGSFNTALTLVFYKVYHLVGKHYLSMTAALGYSVFAPVHVKGFNAYGGGFKTRGTVYPGNTLTGIISFEYSLNQNWVLALDNVYTHGNKTRFSGHRGFVSEDTLARVAFPSNEALSFAPALEYNFSIHSGLIAGCWFTAAGRNSPIFRNGIISFLYIY